MAAVAAIALALGACGGDEGGAGDEERIGEIVESFVQAGNEGDAETACELLAEEQAERIGRLAGGECAEALGQFFESAARTETEVRVDDVRIDGERATADVTVRQDGEPREESLLLVEEDGEWRLADAGF